MFSIIIVAAPTTAQSPLLVCTNYCFEISDWLNYSYWLITSASLSTQTSKMLPHNQFVVDSSFRKPKFNFTTQMIFMHFMVDIHTFEVILILIMFLNLFLLLFCATQD